MLSAEDREVYAEKYLRMTYWFAHKYRSRFPGLEFDDIKGCALLGLAQACARFDPEYGYAFSTYLNAAIYGQLRHATRKPQVPTISMETPLAEDLTIGKTLADETDYEALTVDRLTQGDLMRGLPPLYQQILLAYAAGKTQAEIGEAIGIKQVQVSRTIKRARRIMQINAEGGRV